MITLQTKVTVTPPPSTARSFGAQDLGPYKRHGGGGFSYGMSGSGDIISGIINFIEGIYHATAHRVINAAFGSDPSKYSIEVDGVANAAIETARIGGTGIIAAPLANVDDLTVAYNAAIQYLHSVVPSIFKTTTGFYKTSGNTTDFFTILVNGVEVSSIDWDRVTAKSNIQIYSKARYASPLESIHRGRILLGARNAVKRALGNKIRASFTYRNPTKYKQIAPPSRGGPYPPLAVPVLEMGLFGSNVTDYVGNIEFNLQKGRSRQRPNMIEKKPAILGGDRWKEKQPRLRPRGK